MEMQPASRGAEKGFSEARPQPSARRAIAIYGCAILQAGL
jgi:hypothetical protein